MTNSTPHTIQRKPVFSPAAGRQAIAFGLALAITALGLAGINTATMPRETADPTSFVIASRDATNAAVHQAQIADASSGIVKQAATAAAHLAAQVGTSR